MEAFAVMLAENPLAVAFGVAGLACQLAWPVFRGRRAMLSVQFGISASYSVHYVLIGAWSGAGVTALGAVQTILALAAGDRPALRTVGMALLPVVWATCLATWSGPASFFALVAVTLIMTGRLQRDTLRLRILLLAAVPFAMGHDFTVGAVPALVGGLVSAAVAATMLAREVRERRRAALAVSSRPSLAFS